MAEDDWENVVIETGVDTLLNYLAENQEADVSQISEDLGVSEDRIKEWGKALDEKGFIEKTYSARKGMILKYTKQNKEVADEKLEELREEVEQKTEKVQEEMKSRQSQVKKAKEKLQELTEELEDNREKEEEVKEKLEKLEEMEENLEEQLQRQEEKEEKLHSRSVDLLSKIDSKLEDIEEAERTAEKFEERKDDIRKKVKTLKKLEKHAETAEEVENQLENLDEKTDEAKNVFEKFVEKTRNLFSSNYNEVLNGTVKEAKEQIAEMESPDYERLIELEKSGKNRRTLIEWLEKKEDE